MVDYILSQHPTRFTADTLPHDQSLLELGVLDSAGVIEFIVFVETTWEIEISDEDITKERMGSLEKMAALVQEYVARKP
jgi:acyl carrier protein